MPKSVTANEHKPRLQVGRYSESGDQNEKVQCASIHVLKTSASSIGVVQQDKISKYCTLFGLRTILIFYPNCLEAYREEILSGLKVD